MSSSDIGDYFAKSVMSFFIIRLRNEVQHVAEAQPVFMDDLRTGGLSEQLVRQQLNKNH